MNDLDKARQDCLNGVVGLSLTDSEELEDVEENDRNDDSNEIGKDAHNRERNESGGKKYEYSLGDVSVFPAEYVYDFWFRCYWRNIFRRLAVWRTPFDTYWALMDFLRTKIRTTPA